MLKRLFGRRRRAPETAPPAQEDTAPGTAPPARGAASVAPEVAIVAAAGDGIVASDGEGRITLANRAALALTGYGERELVGNALHGLLHPACEDADCPVAATARDGTPRTFVADALRRRDGDSTTVEVTLSCLRGGGLVAVLRERRRSADRLRELVEDAEHWIWTADRAGVITFSNAAGEALLGAPAAGRSLLDLVAPADRPAEAQRLEEAAAAGGGWTAQLRRVGPDGARRTLHSHASPVLGPGGELVGWRGVELSVAEPPVEAEPARAAAPAEAEPAAPAQAARSQEDGAEAPAAREIAVVRQPIADAQGTVVGYELLVGGGARGRRPLGEAGMTAAMLLDVFGDVGVERLAGRHPAWVPITPGFLLEVGTPPVRPDRVVLQLPAAPVAADALAALRRLSWSGYALALDGYEGDAELAELLEVAAFVKLVVAGRTDAELRGAIREPAKHGVRLVATRVEAPEEVERCRALGFELFQGGFFAKPSLVRQRRVGTGGVQSLRTLARVAAPDASFEDLEGAISADVGLSLKLLRYVNSAFFSLPRTVGSVHEALTLLGMATVRRWATVMALADATAEAPEELVELALQRARMCEVLGGEPESERADALFTVGLFSVADALLGSPMEEVLETLPFSEEIQAALLRHEGDKGELLQTVKSYERGEFPEPPPAVRDPELSVADAYAEAIDWAADARRSAP